MISIPGRVPIHIHPFFWFLIVLLGWLNSSTFLGTIIWSLVIFVSVLIHEYGHALTARAFGQEAEINLVGLGGLTKRQGPQISLWKEFLIVLDGPIAGFVLCFLAYCLLILTEGNQSPLLAYSLKIAVNVNLFWTLLNLLPVLPLDGGQLLRIILQGMFGFKGVKFAFLTSLILASTVGIYFFLIQQVLMGSLFLMLAFESYQGWSGIKTMAPEDADQDLLRTLNEGLEALKQGRQEDAFSKFNDVRQQAPKGFLYVTATQYAAHILAEQGRLKQAYEWLLPLQNRLSTDYVRLLQQLAYQVQEWEQATKIGQTAYQQDPSMDIALINALSYAVMGEDVPAIGWLRCAIQQGLPNIQAVIKKREFDAIRNTPTFQNWLATYNRSLT